MYSLFTPLGRDNCLFFYFLSIISFALFIITLATGIFTRKRPLAVILACAAPFVTYYVYRLLFSMCVNTTM
jgi:hypothetical protein